MEEVWTKSFEVAGRTFEAVCMRRPFREGFEVHIDVDGEILTFAELGYGDSALLEKARAVVEAYLVERSKK
jgi:hypothetical protein